jgi:arabinogalactan oligomer/maltooligosaccharide transport system permease protein
MSEQGTPTKADLKKRKAATMAPARNWGPGFIVKLILMALIDALGILGIIMAWKASSMVILAVLVILLIVTNYVYFSRHSLPAKYMLPGMFSC